ncbi:FeoB-associated Cys-rich membrane protein [Flavobacteriaceae bacterium]|nr:FeoB-associated Cys-rich membrane protein [Flavobacteriaceae bacterium]
MEWIQLLFVLFAALAAVAFLIYKWMPKSKSKKGGSCDTNCGCH